MSELNLRGKWLADQDPSGDTHVTPILDTAEHVNARNCWCRPVIEGCMVVHHSFDGRELAEPNCNPRYQEPVN